ncbi:MAG: Triheme cytochrome c, partial [Nitrospinae bacterium RIFCSPLOWO2_12_FULL_47_7]
RTTEFGVIPSDQDIFNIISKGMPGTTMPAWKHLPENDRWSLVYYPKTLTNKFEKFYAKGEALETIKAGDPPPSTAEGLVEGKQLFINHCSGCHGLEGRSDGTSTERIVDIDSDALWPRNLTKPWLFRRGSSLKDLYLTIRTGLSGTAMPKFSEKKLSDQQAWNLLHYIKTLATSEDRPDIRPIRTKKVSGDLPLDPENPLWKNAKEYYFPLGGQIIHLKKSYFSTTDSIAVKALYNDNDLAIHLSWDSPAFDRSLKNHAVIRESPAPPLPPEMQLETKEEPETESDEEAKKPLPDAIAIQFPVEPNGKRPYFLNGDPEFPVNLWKWTSSPLETLELNAKGMDKITVQTKDSQGVTAKVLYQYGRYYLVMKRKLTTADKVNDIQFKPGLKTPVAFSIWNGSSEKGSQQQMAVSSWFQLSIE